ncbi:hypothetical protein NFI96_034418, partial [Prochilodus magdalenae]
MMDEIYVNDDDKFSKPPGHGRGHDSSDHNKGVSYKALSEQYISAVQEFNTSECQKCALCGEGWKPFGVKCYYFSTDKLNWTMSRDYCAGKGGHLVVITSRAEQVLLDYENASKCLESFEETERQYEALKVKYRTTHEVISNCSVKCYYFSTDTLNWTMSRDYCAEKGGHLVIITSRAEQDCVTSGVTEDHWLGLNDLETEGKWMWVNKQPLTETGLTQEPYSLLQSMHCFSFKGPAVQEFSEREEVCSSSLSYLCRFWYERSDQPNEPNNWTKEDSSGEDCAKLEPSDKWFDASFSELKKYICKKKSISLQMEYLSLLISTVSSHILFPTDYNEKASRGALNEQYSTTAKRLSVQERNASEECQKGPLCGEGWKSFGVKCYYFSTDKLNWTMSRDYCAGKESHLVIITSRDEQDFLSSRVRETHWIGLNDLETEGKWMWVNNQTLTETGVKFWYERDDEPHEPDNWKEQDHTGENCAALGNEIDVSAQAGRSASGNNLKDTLKILLAALSVLLLCALLALCVLGIRYHNKGSSYEVLREQYSRAVERLSEQEHNASETERHYEALKVKYRTAHKVISKCSECQKCALCGEGWKPYGLKCYYFSTIKLNWTMSRDYCAGKRSHLVIITSRAEQDFLSTSVGETHWIGLNDLETEGKWMWVNKQPLTGLTFWYTHENGLKEPDNWKKYDRSGEDCASLGNESGFTDKWFDASCRKLKKYICE